MIISATDSKGDGRTKEIFSQIGERARRAVGWVEPRLVAARPTTQAVAIGGSHDAERRSTLPTTDCASAALGPQSKASQESIKPALLSVRSNHRGLPGAA